jgi:hypothetical protein
MPKPKRKRTNIQPRSKPAKSGARWQSSILRRVLSHVRSTLSDPQSDLDAAKVALAGQEQGSSQPANALPN